MRHARPTLLLLTLLTVVGLVASPLVLSAIGAIGETTYVGQSGVSHDGDGGRTAHINTCGETVTRVEVTADGHTFSYKATAPFTGVAAFEPGTPPPHGWTLEKEGAPGDVDKHMISVDAELHARPEAYRFRSSEVADAELEVLAPGAIALGQPSPTGDRELQSARQFSSGCPEPVTRSPSILGLLFPSD
ncbi:hypothetical protein B842_04470 [Corynebacterium humireducens NBRC 106098 = DSM 45392]|uniref:Uncharacterized protein n=1 Tax=Corynebacterium humireducens NBRC 106098 = DSM 45392 TaxID=1223515 RepID=A0A0B5D6E3_9CORY|nr:hypothetical protein [Corynebacterium humireducens]AJE32747.1 hypothetical protein B842_04470 [Corynebacterium humireducens NBRC 106098 = DSM 45392]